MKRSPRILAFALLLLLAACDGQRPDSAPPDTAVSAQRLEDGSVLVRWNAAGPGAAASTWEIAYDGGEWTPVGENERVFDFPEAEAALDEPPLHTLRVRSVDEHGERDATPAAVSFSAGGIAPSTVITYGPNHVGLWGPDVEFHWEGSDDDGFVVGYRHILTSTMEWRLDFGIQDPNALPATLAELIAWADTLTFRPLGNGTYDLADSVWVTTADEETIYPDTPSTPALPDLYLFIVRAIDDTGLEEAILDVPDNARTFDVTTSLSGPSLTITSNIAGSWSSGEPPAVREVFAGSGLRFEWSAEPGPSGAPVACYSYAVDDSSVWSPCDDTTEWPLQPGGGKELLWFPEPGPHALFVRAVDEAGLERVLVADLLVFAGPRFCPEEDRRIVVVLDTNPDALIQDQAFPPAYRELERALVPVWLNGYDFEIFETSGTTAPTASLLDCASSVVWIHSADVDQGSSSVLLGLHTGAYNLLTSYVASGGNLVLCGIQPSETLRFFDGPNGPTMQQYPVLFGSTLTNPDFFPHWAAFRLGIDRIEDSIGNTSAPGMEVLRLSTATSEITGGPHPYPDLEFDPLTLPQGTLQGGFGYYDRGVQPLGGVGPDAEVIYTFNDEGIPIAVRRLIAPGLFGNTVFLGFHPYYLDRPAFAQLVAAVMSDFGERRGRVKESGVAPDFQVSW